MSSTYYKLSVTDRKKFGTKESNQIRKSGFIPAVLYYSGEKNNHISIDKSVFFHAMQSSQRVYEIEQGKETQFVMIKEIQYHPVTDEIIHVDLMRVRRSEKMSISVPLVLVGNSIGLKEGGILSQSINQVEISCLPTNVPENIEIEISSLELGDSLNVGDLNIKDKEVELLTASDINILTIQAPSGSDDSEELEESIGEEESELETTDQESKENESK
jgi:large subunit ribosomal protein L25